MLTNNYMHIAIKEARKAFHSNEVPVGAVIVDKKGNIIAKGHNNNLLKNDPTAHAEIVVIRKASRKLKTSRLDECDIYVSLEPCTMCAAAISLAKLRRVYFAAFDNKGGAIENGVHFYENKTCHHRPEVYGGICELEAKELLQEFFKGKRS